MATIFLVIIYMAFISLGMPDSLLGVSWAEMRIKLDVPLESAGLIFMVTTGGTIISSLASGFVLKKLGVGLVTFISTLLTAIALLSFSFAPSYIWLVVSAIPLGLGAGSIDAALNHFVAMNYKAHHMSWLHCFWGVGAMTGPIVVSSFIQQGQWENGYRTVSIIQFIFSGVLLLVIPIWKKIESNKEEVLEDDDVAEEGEIKKPLQIKGAKLAMFAFACYCGAESTMGLWGSSFLIHTKGVSTAVAAQWVSLFYGGITVGRFLSGFATLKFNNRTMIRTGQGVMLFGVILLIMPLPTLFSLIGFILIGLGGAPIYPCMMHNTPVIFGKKAAQSLIGYQMAFAYIGATFLPPILGYTSSVSSIGIMPFFIFVYVIAMLILTEKIKMKTQSNMV